jgi:hypothetical protein
MSICLHWIKEILLPGFLWNFVLEGNILVWLKLVKNDKWYLQLLSLMINGTDWSWWDTCRGSCSMTNPSLFLTHNKSCCVQRNIHCHLWRSFLKYSPHQNLWNLQIQTWWTVEPQQTFPISFWLHISVGNLSMVPSLTTVRVICTWYHHTTCAHSCLQDHNTKVPGRWWPWH